MLTVELSQKIFKKETTMYECFSPSKGNRRITTDIYAEACFYHSLGYVVYDWNLLHLINTSKHKNDNEAEGTI